MIGEIRVLIYFRTPGVAVNVLSDHLLVAYSVILSSPQQFVVYFIKIAYRHYNDGLGSLLLQVIY